MNYVPIAERNKNPAAGSIYNQIPQILEDVKEEDDEEDYTKHLNKRLEKNFDHLKSIQKIRNNNVSVVSNGCLFGQKSQSNVQFSSTNLKNNSNTEL